MEFKGIMPTFHKGNSPGIPSPTEDACALHAVVGTFDKGLINTQFAVSTSEHRGMAGRSHAEETALPSAQDRRPPTAPLPPAEDHWPRWHRRAGRGAEEAEAEGTDRSAYYI